MYKRQNIQLIENMSNSWIFLTSLSNNTCIRNIILSIICVLMLLKGHIRNKSLLKDGDNNTIA